MSLDQKLLVGIPTILLGLIIVVSGVIFSILGLVIARRFVPHHRLKTHNDVTGPIFGTLGTVYAVFLAFVLIIVWQNFDKSKLNVENEANCLGDLYRDAESFSATFKQEARLLLNEYTKAVVDEEWKTMVEGRPSSRVEEIVKKLFFLYGNYLPTTTTEQTFFEESVRKLNELDELRTMRLMDSRTGINPLLWLILIVGGVVVIVFTFFFGAENFKAQLIITVLLTTLISLFLFTILSLDFPFSGSMSISPSPFKQIAINWVVR
jgi:hypothetical protein